MKKTLPEQLNTPVPAEESMPEFSLDDILKEFGTGAKNPSSSTEEAISFHPLSAEIGKKAPENTPPEPPRQLTPVHESAGPDTSSEKQPVILVSKISDTEKQPIEKAVTPPIKVHRSEAPPVQISPPPTLPSAKELLEKYRTLLGSSRLRLAATAFFMVINLLLLCYVQAFPQAERFISDKAASVLSLVLLVLCSLLGFEVLWKGISDLLQLRISLYTLGVFAIILCVIDALTNASCYCAVGSLLLYCLFRALVRLRVGMFLTLRTLCAFESPMGVYNIPDLLPHAVGLRRDAAKSEDFVAQLLQPDSPQQFFRLYATIVLPLTLGLSILLAISKYQAAFIRTWLLLLLSATPLGAMSAYSHPFSWLAKRLSRIGGALCGWHGAEVFGGKHTIILRDGDLFPATHISSNGMKLYGSYSAAEVISYTLATLEAAEHPLAPLFDSLLNSQYGKHTHAKTYRFYDTGGIGAEVAQHVVLAGTLHFMRTMGVHMPEGTRVRQAVYVSIDGELAGVFAIKYKPSPSTRAGLRAILGNDHFSVILATRDFLITPELLAARYEIPTDGLTCPVYSERIRLSEAESGEVSTQGAMIAKDTFGAFAFTVSAGQRLRSASLASSAVNLFAGILGILLCVLLLLWNAGEIASPLHLAAFHLLWGFVSAFISFVLLRF